MTLTWQNGRQLATLENGNTSVSYQYNEEGLRTGKIVNGITTEYYWNGSQLLGQKTGTSLLHFLYDERGLLVGFNDGTKTYLYTRNLQGDIVSITDTATGNTVAQYIYDSWGNILTAIGAMAEINPFRYRGYYFDAETGLYYLQSRYYDAEVGRFLNADGVLGANGDMHAYNLYVYCGNNPIMRLDSSGYFFAEIWEFMKAVAAATENAMIEMAPMYDACGAAVLVDGPLPIGDTIGAIGAAILSAAALVIGVSAVLEGAPSIAVPKVEEKEKDITIPDMPKQTVIYRYGGTNPGNLTPREKDRYTGLSFSTIPKPGAAMTTIEALNATGIVYAVQDSATHVSVRPVYATMDDWIRLGSNSIWTMAVKSVVIKWG